MRRPNPPCQELLFNLRATRMQKQKRKGCTCEKKREEEQRQLRKRKDKGRNAPPPERLCVAYQWRRGVPLPFRCAALFDRPAQKSTAAKTAKACMHRGLAPGVRLRRLEQRTHSFNFRITREENFCVLFEVLERLAASAEVRVPSFFEAVLAKINQSAAAPAVACAEASLCCTYVHLARCKGVAQGVSPHELGKLRSVPVYEASRKELFLRSERKLGGVVGHRRRRDKDRLFNGSASAFL